MSVRLAGALLHKSFDLSQEYYKDQTVSAASQVQGNTGLKNVNNPSKTAEMITQHL